MFSPLIGQIFLFRCCFVNPRFECSKANISCDLKALHDFLFCKVSILPLKIFSLLSSSFFFSSSPAPFKSECFYRLIIHMNHNIFEFLMKGNIWLIRAKFKYYLWSLGARIRACRSSSRRFLLKSLFLWTIRIDWKKDNFYIDSLILKK